LLVWLAGFLSDPSLSYERLRRACYRPMVGGQVPATGVNTPRKPYSKGEYTGVCVLSSSVPSTLAHIYTHDTHTHTHTQAHTHTHTYTYTASTQLSETLSGGKLLFGLALPCITFDTLLHQCLPLVELTHLSELNAWFVSTPH
jgi:hypothetical protein